MYIFLFFITKTVWHLIAICSIDFNSKKITQTQFTISLALLLQIEIVAFGSLSCMSNPKDHHHDYHENSNAKALCDILSLKNDHQKIQLLTELNNLFRVRHQLLIM